MDLCPGLRTQGGEGNVPVSIFKVTILELCGTLSIENWEPIKSYSNYTFLYGWNFVL